MASLAGMLSGPPYSIDMGGIMRGKERLLREERKIVDSGHYLEERDIVAGGYRFLYPARVMLTPIVNLRLIWAP